jgi:hypothetical protein
VGKSLSPQANSLNIVITAELPHANVWQEGSSEIVLDVNMSKIFMLCQIERYGCA